MRAYYFDDVLGEARLPHDSHRSVSEASLANLGVLYWRIPQEDDNWEEAIDTVAKERTYKNRDTITVSKQVLGDQYEQRMKMFYDECVQLLQAQRL